MFRVSPPRTVDVPVCEHNLSCAAFGGVGCGDSQEGLGQAEGWSLICQGGTAFALQLPSAAAPSFGTAHAAGPNRGRAALRCRWTCCIGTGELEASGIITSCAVSGDHIVLGDAQGRVLLVSGESGAVVCELDPPAETSARQDAVGGGTSVAADGPRVGDEGSEVTVATVAAHSCRVTCLVFAPDGRTVACCNGVGRVSVLDVTNGNVVCSVAAPLPPPTQGGVGSRQGGKGEPRAPAAEPDSNDGGSVPGDAGSEGFSLEHEHHAVTHCCFSPDGGLLAFCGENETVNVLVLPRVRRGEQRDGRNPDPCDDGSTRGGSRWGGAGVKDGRVEALRGELQCRELVGHDLWVQQVGFSSDKNTLASIDVGGKVLLWDHTRARVVGSHRAHGAAGTFLQFVSRPAGAGAAGGGAPLEEVLLTASLDGIVAVWELFGPRAKRGLRPLARVYAHATGIKHASCAVEHPGPGGGGLALLTCGLDRTAALTTVEPRATRCTWRFPCFHAGRLRAATFSQAGDRMAAVVAGCMEVWLFHTPGGGGGGGGGGRAPNTAPPPPTLLLPGGDGWPLCIAFSPESGSNGGGGSGPILAAGTSDGRVALWELANLEMDSGGGGGGGSGTAGGDGGGAGCDDDAASGFVEALQASRRAGGGQGRGAGRLIGPDKVWRPGQARDPDTAAGQGVQCVSFCPPPGDSGQRGPQHLVSCDVLGVVVVTRLPDMAAVVKLERGGTTVCRGPWLATSPRPAAAVPTDTDTMGAPNSTGKHAPTTAAPAPDSAREATAAALTTAAGSTGAAAGKRGGGGGGGGGNGGGDDLPELLLTHSDDSVYAWRAAGGQLVATCKLPAAGPGAAGGGSPGASTAASHVSCLHVAAVAAAGAGTAPAGGWEGGTAALAVFGTTCGRVYLWEVPSPPGMLGGTGDVHCGGEAGGGGGGQPSRPRPPVSLRMVGNVDELLAPGGVTGVTICPERARGLVVAWGPQFAAVWKIPPPAPPGDAWTSPRPAAKASPATAATAATTTGPAATPEGGTAGAGSAALALVLTYASVDGPRGVLGGKGAEGRSAEVVAASLSSSGEGGRGSDGGLELILARCDGWAHAVRVPVHSSPSDQVQDM